MGSLAIFGFLLGVMIGRFYHPEALHLQQFEVGQGQLLLWFNVQPQLQVTEVAGALSVRFTGLGAERRGRLQVAGQSASWRLQRHGQELELRVLAVQPLRAQWRVEQVAGRWCMKLDLALQ